MAVLPSRVLSSDLDDQDRIEGTVQVTSVRDVLVSIGKQVGDRRRRVGYTQKQLAELLGSTQPSQNDFEMGCKNASNTRVTRIVAIANALNCDIEFRLIPKGDVPSPPPEPVKVDTRKVIRLSEEAYEKLRERRTGHLTYSELILRLLRK